MAEGIGQLCDDLGVEPSDIALVSTRVCQHTGGKGNVTTMHVCVCSHALDMTSTARKSVHVCGVCGSVLEGLLLLACTRACTHTGCSQSHCSAVVLCVSCALCAPLLCSWC